MTRLNFEVDDSLREMLEELRVSRGARTQKQVFEEALELLARRELLVRRQGRSLIAVRPEAVEEIARLVGDVVILDVPMTQWGWLVEREGWRATPWIKGTRFHVSDVMAFLDETRDENLTDAEVAQELELTVAAVTECRRFIDVNRELVEAEEREAARRILQRGGYAAPPR